MGDTTTTTSGPQYRRTEPSIAVLIHEAIAAQEGPDRDDYPPLYESINPDALNNLFTPTQAGTERHGKVTFQYCGYHVTVTGERTVSFDPIGGDNS